MVWHPNHLPARSQRGGGGKAHRNHVPPRCLATSSWGRETRAPVSLSQRVRQLFLEISAQCTHQCHPSPCSGHRFLPQALAPERSRSPHVPCAGVPPCQLQGFPAGEVLLTHPVTAAFCPTAGLLLWGAGLPLVAASLFNPQLQKAVCGQKRWLAGASEAPGDGCLGLGLWLAHRAASPCPRRGC